MITTFVSRSNWFPAGLKATLQDFYSLLDEIGFSPTTLGTNVAPLQSPFEEMRALMAQAQCAIILGTTQLVANEVTLKGKSAGRMALPTEWNQIEASAALMLDLPTLVILHKNVTPRGLFERGSGNIFIHSHDMKDPKWTRAIRPALQQLHSRVAP